MDFLDYSEKLLQKTLSVLKSHDIPDSKFNRLKCLVPIVYDEKNPILLRDCALHLSSQTLLSSSLGEVKEYSSFVYDLFLLVKSKGSLFKSAPYFTKALYIFLSVKEEDLEVLQSSVSEIFYHLFYHEVNQDEVSIEFCSGLSSSIFRSACSQNLSEILLKASRKRYQEALATLKFFCRVFSKIQNPFPMEHLMEPVRHVLSLGHNELYQMTLLFIQKASLVGQTSFFPLVVESKPPFQVRLNYSAWLKCKLSLLNLPDSLPSEEILEEMWSYLMDLDESASVQEGNLISYLSKTNNHDLVSSWISIKISSAQNLKSLNLSLNLAKHFLRSVSKFENAEYALLEDLCRVRDTSSSDFSLNPLIEGIYATALKTVKLDELITHVHLYDSSTSTFRAWMLQYIERNNRDDVSCFHRHFYPFIVADSSMDGSVSLLIWSVFPAFLASTSDLNSFSEYFEKVFVVIREQECIRGILLNSLASWLEIHPSYPSTVQELSVLCLELYSSEPFKHEYILSVLGKLLKVHPDAPSLLSRLMSQIKAIGSQENAAIFTRLLEAFSAALPSCRKQIFEFSLTLVQSHKQESLVKSAFKSLTTLLKLEASLVQELPVDIVRKAPLKEKLRILCVAPAAHDMLQEFLPEVIFATKDTSEKTRSLAKEVLIFWSKNQDLMELLKLALVGLIGTSSVMISGTISAMDIILQNGNVAAFDGEALGSTFISGICSVADESNEVVKSAMILLNNLIQRHPVLFEGVLLERSIAYMFSKPRSSFHHIMNQLKEFLAIAGNTFGWERVCSFVPKDDQALVSHIRKEQNRLKLLPPPQEEESKKKRSGKDWTRKKEKFRIL